MFKATRKATRKVTRKVTREVTRKAIKQIQHHHMLIRMETMLCPKKTDISKVKQLIKKILVDIDMKLIGTPHVYYVDVPKANKGITSVSSIQTSHISFHFWNTPDNGILQNPKSKCLLQFDIYTCGTLTKHQANIVLQHLSVYIPTHINIDILNRKTRLKIEHHMHWNDNGKSTYENWLQSNV